jgi:hypothetical protein
MKCGDGSQALCNENQALQDFMSEILRVVMALLASQFLSFLLYLYLFICGFSVPFLNYRFMLESF